MIIVEPREFAQLKRLVDRIDAESRRRPVIDWTPPPPLPTGLWMTVGGNLLTYLGTDGIVRRLDTVAASELPDGIGGPGIVTVPADPNAVGLPNGVGVARRIDADIYTWVLLDSTTPSTIPDLQGFADMFLVAATVTLDKVVGGTTYRYNLVRPVSGWW